MLPVTSNARFNGYLKEIADALAIEKSDPSRSEEDVCYDGATL